MTRLGGTPPKGLVPEDYKPPTNPSTPAKDKEFKELKDKVVDKVEERNKLVERYQQLMSSEPARGVDGNVSPERAAWQAQVNEVGTKLKSVDTDLGVWLNRIMEIGPPPEMKEMVGELQQVTRTHLQKKIDPSEVKRMITLEHAQNRDTIYILYGYLEKEHIESELDDLKPVIDKFKAKGYKVVVDEQTTYDEWKEYMKDEHMAGLIWSSHGWVSHGPGDSEPDELTSRVWTTRAQPGSKKIFATEWAEKCPDDLAFVVMASCGTGGVYEKFHEYCEDPSHKSRDAEPTRIISFADTLKNKTDNLITYYGASYGILDRYNPDVLVDSLYDRSKLEGGDRPSGGGLLDFLFRRGGDD